MKLLRRKTDQFLKKWRENENRMPLIVKGARQIGKTASIMQFANSNYQGKRIKLRCPPKVLTGTLHPSLPSIFSG